MPLDINSMPKNRKVETKTIFNFYARYFTFICNLVPTNGKFSLAATIVCCFTNLLTKNGLHIPINGMNQCRSSPLIGKSMASYF